MPELERPAPPIGGKVEGIVKHCMYEIATGQWAEGDQLPSLRQGQELWSANHLTVLRAYRRLEELGLVRREPRRGFFVARHETSDRLRRDREQLDALYESVRARLLESGPRSVVGAFRYLAELADSRARREPECAFVECTDYQAEGHAREVRDRLDLPCLALRTDRLSAQPLPPGLRFLLTTSFHVAEVGRAVAGTGLEALSVPIELCADLLAQLVQSAEEIAFFATDGDHAHHIARDAAPHLGSAGAVVTAQGCQPADLDDALHEALDAVGDRRAVVLSPSLWTAAPESWRKDRRVSPLATQIVPSIWGQVADALGLPLRSLA